MFDSDIIDVALGMVLVYLLLSLIVSATNEAIAQFLRWRARDLEEALLRMLKDPALVQAIYDHELIKTLTIRESFWDRLGRPVVNWLTRRQTTDYLRPSYIPNHTFVLTMLEALRSRVLAVTEGEEANLPADQQVALAALASPTLVGAVTVTGVGAGAQAVQAAPAPAAAAGAADELAKLRALVESLRPFAPGIIPADVLNALSTLVYDQLVNNVAEAYQNLENWFDNVMQRASSLYKAKTQHAIFFISLVLVLALNADSLMIGNVLWHDAPMRASLVSAADQITREALPDTTSGLVLVQQIITQTKQLQIPLGWNQNPTDPSDPTAGPAKVPQEMLLVWLLMKGLGMLGTIIAISVGAPFWYDLLNKLMKFRSSFQPPAKPSSEPKPTS